MKRTVDAQTSGLETSVSRICWTRYSPYSGGAAGGSHSASGGIIHDTAGSLLVATSSANEAGYVGTVAWLAMAVSLGVVGFQKVLKYGKGLSSNNAVGSLYTFQLTPASLRDSAIVGQVNVP